MLGDFCVAIARPMGQIYLPRANAHPIQRCPNASETILKLNGILRGRLVGQKPRPIFARQRRLTREPTGANSRNPDHRSFDAAPIDPNAFKLSAKASRISQI
jgi:hypothetical protein